MVDKAKICFILTAFLVASCFVEAQPAYATSIAENTWITKESTPTTEGVAKAATVNGKIYLIGGSFNFEYDPSSGNWTTKTPMPTQRWHCGIAVFNSKIYLIGGLTSKPGPDYGLLYFGTNEVYYPQTDTWETKQPMPANASNPLQANVVGDKIYVLTLEHHYCYDIAADSWSNKTSIPSIGGIETAGVEDKIYAFCRNQTLIYESINDSWSLGAPMLTPLSLPAVCTTTGINASKRIYLFGGEEDTFGPTTNITQVYDPLSNTWVFGEQMPTARCGAAVAFVNDLIYVIGGSDGWVGFSYVNEQYAPFGYGTIVSPYVSSTPSISPQTTAHQKEAAPFPVLIVLATLAVLVATLFLAIFLFLRRQKSK
jgi:N-acetylneuraminic acid mutarotase